MRKIALVTVGRSDYWIYRPILELLAADPDVDLCLVVAGMHLSPEFGLTVRQIEADGFEIAERVEMLLSSETPEGIAKSMGVGTVAFAQVFARLKADLLVVLGDRFEMHAAVVAAVPFNLPIAHIHGGERTDGAFDEALRHSITKLSHLHFVSTAEYGRRVVQLGEEPWRVTVSGAPALDRLREIELLDPDQLHARFGLRLDEAPLLVTFHPSTLQYAEAEAQLEEVLAALTACGRPAIITLPNADTNGRALGRRISEFVRDWPSAQALDNLGSAYFSVMALSAAMVGNSSSGIIEAASFHLPVVNVGDRQRGRIRAINVVDVEPERGAILAGLEMVLDPAFRAKLSDLQNPYYTGNAAQTIVARLKEVPLNQRLLQKRFWDLPAASQEHVSDVPMVITPRVT